MFLYFFHVWNWVCIFINSVRWFKNTYYFIMNMVMENIKISGIYCDMNVYVHFSKSLWSLYFGYFCCNGFPLCLRRALSLSVSVLAMPSSWIWVTGNAWTDKLSAQMQYKSRVFFGFIYQMHTFIYFYDNRIKMSLKKYNFVLKWIDTNQAFGAYAEDCFCIQNISVTCIFKLKLNLKVAEIYIFLL